ncbi:hypothetical protein Anas_07202 [Armadillidium nasatum]|uniref:Uncharacterized protein n=1 Tax=Armadillidium nasatum TaxID=96803 RepID=A0A5N5TBF2_9CRUS|nr:hypothetical protein Anas_07202 [Armadillidium nasatum]
MLSLTSVIQPQIALPLSCIASQYTNVRHSTRVGTVSSIKKKEYSPRNEKVSELEVNEVKEILNSIPGDVLKKMATPTMLKNLALLGPFKLNSQNYTTTRCFSQLLGRRLPWQESHSSFNTFSENKNGSPSLSSLRSTILQQTIILVEASEPNIQLIGEPSNSKPLSDKFKQGLRTKESVTQSVAMDTEVKQRLHSLLGEDSSEEAQKNIKIAFAEGYLAG